MFFIAIGMPFIAFAIPVYLVNDNGTIFLANASFWKDRPFVEISQIATVLNLKWSYKREMGIVAYKGNFISFNARNHMGMYDALYKTDDVATDVKAPYILVKAIAELVGLKMTVDPAGVFLIQSTPTISLKGVLLYGKTFTIFFNSKSSKTTINVTSHGMVTTVKVFPVSFSKDYIPANSPLVIEKDGEVSAVYRITSMGKIKISTAIGYPSLPIQEATSLNFENGIRYNSLTYKTLTGKIVRLNLLKIPPSAAQIKVVYPHSGIGTTELLSSITSSTAVAAIGFSSGKSPGFAMVNGKIISAPIRNRPTLVWNDKKFDIIETSPITTVNIGYIPFMLDGINCATGNVVMYTQEYGPEIPKSEDRMYFEVSNGVIVGEKYVSHIKNDNTVIFSLTSKYKLFLKNVKTGDFVTPFTSLRGVELGDIKGAIQGQCLLIYDSKKMKLWFSKERGDFKGPKMVVGIKNKALYFLRMNSKNSDLDLDDISDILLNLGFSKAMCLGSGKNVSMIVGSKIVDSKDQGLYPTGFGIEIDQTTGGA